ncbi:MAG: sensor histidine kinase [Terrimicrobiaceae bacterium]
MNFKVAARVVSQLGAELISSDDIAVYELVKNGFDAHSAVVEVHINYRASISIIRQLQEPAVKALKHSNLSSACPPEIKQQIVDRIKDLAINVPEFQFCTLTPAQFTQLENEVFAAGAYASVIRAIGKINSIDVVDYGDGMDAGDVEKYYLTIGTTHRLVEVEEIQRCGAGDRMPSGEKGIGRLSAMRLGRELEVFTVPRNATEAVLVSIHWREFDYRRDDNLGDIPVHLEVKPKGDASSGTFLSISDVTSDWTRETAADLGAKHLAKFIDPFPSFADGEAPVSTPRKVILKWNGEVIDTRELIKTYLENCQNSLSCRLRFDGEVATLESHFHFGEVKTNPPKSFTRNYSVADFSDLSNAMLAEVGPIEFTLYHYPRNRLKAIPQFASRSEVKDWLDRWCGGLMVFRDGIRVLPYADKGDDWLNLDGQALRGRGFRVNRIQVVGCARISRFSNPNLIDQTNREGFRDNPAYQTFRTIISRHLQENFVSALDEHLSKEKGDVEHLSRQTAQEYDALSQCAADIEAATKGENWTLAKEASIRLKAVVGEIRELNDAVERVLQEKEGNRIQVLELAATGMAAESMAHDLEGVIETAITSLNEAALGSADKRVSAAVRHIRSVHKALLIQLKQISPGPARSRRRASTFDVNTAVQEAASFYEERLTRHNIALTLPDCSLVCQIHAVNGHVRQIFDNLFRNSIYWVQDTQKKFVDAGPQWITLSLDAHARTLIFSDSGVGVAKEDAEWVFQPFNSRRELGRGLGLFICRELAQFNNIRLELNLSDLNRWNRARSFTIEFQGA